MTSYRNLLNTSRRPWKKSRKHGVGTLIKLLGNSAMPHRLLSYVRKSLQAVLGEGLDPVNTSPSSSPSFTSPIWPHSSPPMSLTAPPRLQARSSSQQQGLTFACTVPILMFHAGFAPLVLLLLFSSPPRPGHSTPLPMLWGGWPVEYCLYFITSHRILE